MYVRRIKIENIRGFGNEEHGVNLDLRRDDGSCPGWTVIAGRNGAGKSTFLRSIALALSGPDSAKSIQTSFAGWIRDGAAAGSVELEIGYDVEDRFQNLGRLPKDVFSARLEWTRDDAAKSGEPLLTSVPKYDKKVRGPWRGPWAPNPNGWLVVGYGPFRRLSGHAADAQRLMVGINHVPRLVTLFREDASLIESVQWLKELYLRALEEREGAKALQNDVLEVLGDGLLPDGVTVDHVDSDGLWVKQNGRRLNLSELSDGYRVVAALALDILRHVVGCFVDGWALVKKGSHVEVNVPGVVLIDEIDAHLHVSWQRRIGYWLKKRFPRIQFIVSSHSPFVCQAADTNGLVRLPAPGEDPPRVSHLDARAYKRIKYGTFDDAAMSSLFGLEHTWSDEAEQIRREYSQLRMRSIRGGLSAQEEKRLGQLELDLQFSASQDAEIEHQAVQSMVGNR